MTFSRACVNVISCECVPLLRCFGCLWCLCCYICNVIFIQHSQYQRHKTHTLYIFSLSYEWIPIYDDDDDDDTNAWWTHITNHYSVSVHLCMIPSLCMISWILHHFTQKGNSYTNWILPNEEWMEFSNSLVLFECHGTHPQNSNSFRLSEKRFNGMKRDQSVGFMFGTQNHSGPRCI